MQRYYLSCRLAKQNQTQQLMQMRVELQRFQLVHNPLAPLNFYFSIENVAGGLSASLMHNTKMSHLIGSQWNSLKREILPVLLVRKSVWIANIPIGFFKANIPAANEEDEAALCGTKNREKSTGHFVILPRLIRSKMQLRLIPIDTQQWIRRSLWGRDRFSIGLI